MSGSQPHLPPVFTSSQRHREDHDFLGAAFGHDVWPSSNQDRLQTQDSRKVVLINLISSFLISLHWSSCVWGPLRQDSCGGRRKKDGGNREVQARLQATQAAGERVTAETDGPRQPGPCSYTNCLHQQLAATISSSSCKSTFVHFLSR